VNLSGLSYSTSILAIYLKHSSNYSISVFSVLEALEIMHCTNLHSTLHYESSIFNWGAS